MENLRRNSGEIQKIAIPIQDGYDFVPVADIIFCEANGSYTEIQLANKKNKVTVAKTLKEYELLLPDDVFFRVHNSFIININHVSKYYKGRGGYVEMSNGVMIEVAARRKLLFLKKLGLGS